MRSSQLRRPAPPVRDRVSSEVVAPQGRTGVRPRGSGHLPGVTVSSVKRSWTGAAALPDR